MPTIDLSDKCALVTGAGTRVGTGGARERRGAGQRLAADEHVGRIPLGNFGGARSVADAVVYLARAAFVTGTEIVVDRGRSLA
jgi:NAD(P)-dependent dehydrogenase (short-subunit alcohol dehydrogenase family)